jgi:hypothetical protein
MPHHLRRRILLIGCALYGVAFTWAATNEVIRPAVEDYFECHRWQRVLEQSHKESEALDKQARELQARSLAQDELCRELIAGRITLAQAGRQLRELPNQPYGFVEKLRLNEAGDTDDERLCNHIIDRACDLLRSEPVRAEALRQKLKAELQAGARR